MTKPCNPKNNQNNNNENEDNHKEDEGRNLNLIKKKNKPACAACKKQRKGCVETCFLAPYFPHTKTPEFNAVHDLFGLCNVQRILKQHENHEQRKDITEALIWEAQMWLQDPVRGSYGAYTKLKQQYDMLLTNYTQLLQPQPQPRQQQGAIASGPTLMSVVQARPQQREEIIGRNDAESWGYTDTVTSTSSGSNSHYNGPIWTSDHSGEAVVPVQAQSYYVNYLMNSVLIQQQQIDGLRLGYGDQRYRQKTAGYGDQRYRQQTEQERVFGGSHDGQGTDHSVDGGHETDYVDAAASFRQNSAGDHANHKQ